jgi:hypothetical protein
MVASSDLSLDPAAMGGEGDGIREKISTGGARQKLIGNPRKILCYGPDGVAASRTPKRAKTEVEFILFPLRLLSMRNTDVPHCPFSDRS